MNREFKNILKTPWKGWRAVLVALVLIALTPPLVCAVGALVIGCCESSGESGRCSPVLVVSRWVRFLFVFTDRGHPLAVLLAHFASFPSIRRRACHVNRHFLHRGGLAGQACVGTACPRICRKG